MDRRRKQRLVALARAAGLLPIFEAARFLQKRRRFKEENTAFLKAHADFATPPLWWMHDMYSHTSYARYWRTGRETAQAIAQMIDAHHAAPHPRVADWGCGLARVVRWLPDRYQCVGFDYNGQAVRWNAAHIDGVEFRKNELLPPLPANDGDFDALYALSVFTHLSEDGHRKWIEEIERVLAPGGLFIGAFHMVPPSGQLSPAEQAEFGAGRLVIRGGVKEGSRIFTAYQPEPYLRQDLLRSFDILEGPRELLGQTVIVARRRA